MTEQRKQALRDIVRGAGVVYTGLALEIVLAFLAQWLAAKYLSTADFGSVTTGLALLNVGAIVASLGLGSGLTRFLPRIDEDRKIALVRTAFVLTLPVSLLLGTALTLNAQWIATNVFRDAGLAASLRVFSAVIPAAALLTVAIGAIRGRKQSRYRVYVENLVRPVVRMGLVVLAVMLGLKQTGFATAYAIPYVIGAVVAIGLILRSTAGPLVGRLSDVKFTGRVVRYSVPMVLSDTASFVYRSADIFILVYFLGRGAVGVYGVAYAAARLLLLFSTAMNFLGSPVSSQLEAEDGIEEAVAVNRSVLRWLVVVSVPASVPFLFFPDVFIAEVYRPAYAAGGTALAILAAGFAAHNVLSPNISLLEALGHSRLIAFNTLSAAIANVLLNLLLIPGGSLPGGIAIPSLGLEGAALATVAAYLLRDGLTVAEVRYVTGTGVTSWKVIAPVILALPLFGGTAVLAPSVPATLPSIVAVSAGFALVYLLGIVVVLGFEEEEVMLVKSIEERYEVDLGPVTAIVERFS